MQERLLGLAVVVMAIVIVFSMLLPSTVPPGPRRIAARAECGNNLRQLALALSNYHDALGRFPPAYVADDNGKPMHSWRVLILPFIEQDNLYKAYDLCEPWNGPNNSKLHERIVDLLQCPACQKKYGSREPQCQQWTNYLMITGPDAVSFAGKSISVDEISDGASQTIVLVEVSSTNIHWMEPKDISVDDLEVLLRANSNKSGQQLRDRENHLSGFHVAYADGHVEIIRHVIEPERIRALATINDGESAQDRE